MGVSFATIKSWITAGKIKTFVTPGGHHRIPAGEVQRCIKKFSTSPTTRRISGRNQLIGTIIATSVQGLMAQVILKVHDQIITSIITRAAFVEMRLRKGDIVAALIKSTEVMVMRDFEV